MSSPPPPHPPGEVLVVNAASMESPQSDFDAVKITDIDEDESGKAKGVYGQLWSQLSSKQLRTVCSRLAIKGAKNAKKAAMVEMIIKWYFNRKNYYAMQQRNNDFADGVTCQMTDSTGGATRPRREGQCAFRLMNLLFSDAFAAEFACIGNVATREMLDTGKASNDKHFWEKVEVAFMEPNDEYGRLNFQDCADIFASQDHIDPSIIVKHDWKKLRTIWKSVNADYKAALARYTLSGNHVSEFFGFCNGKLEPFYLRKHLDARPNLNEMVAAELPDECFVSSDMEPAELERRIIGSQATTNSSSSGGSSISATPAGSAAHNADSSSSRNKGPPAKKQKQNAAVISETAILHVADAIRDLSSVQTTNSLMTSKKLLYLEKEDSRRELELQQQSHQATLNEWETVSNNLRLFRQDLENSYDPITNKELEDDIAGLVIRKKELAQKLGFKR